MNIVHDSFMYPPWHSVSVCECTRVSSTSNAFIGLQNFQITRKTFLLNSAALLTQGTSDELSYTTLHRGAICQFPVQWIYYSHISESTGKKTGKTHLCVLNSSIFAPFFVRFSVLLSYGIFAEKVCRSREVVN